MYHIRHLAGSVGCMFWHITFACMLVCWNLDEGITILNLICLRRDAGNVDWDSWNNRKWLFAIPNIHQTIYSAYVRNITKSRVCAASLCTEGGCTRGLRVFRAEWVAERNKKNSDELQEHMTRTNSKMEVMLMLKPERVIINSEVGRNRYSVAQVNLLTESQSHRNIVFGNRAKVQNETERSCNLFLQET